jgi:acetate kinase
MIQMPLEKVICAGMLERIGSDEAVFSYKSTTVSIVEAAPIATHKIGLEKIAKILLHPEKGIIKHSNEIYAIGHRVVHGGDSFAATTLVTEDVKKEIQKYTALAPLHNPHNLEGITIAEQLFPLAKQIAVFDTAFFQTMPVKARKYAIPNALYEQHGVQVYGFHGTSHKYVSEKAIVFINKEHSKIITIHLGNGCSITALVNGISIDHSLGFAPGNGLIMGSRSGDIDHAVIFHMVNTLGYSLEDVNTLLTKKSGMLGLTGFSDLRDIQSEAENGNKSCQLALEMNAYRIKKYIGAYAAAMNGLDALVFTAGIGENSATIRRLVCTDMEYFGISLDDQKNEERSNRNREISNVNSKTKVLVIPTNEELEIAKQAFELCN